MVDLEVDIGDVDVLVLESSRSADALGASRLAAQAGGIVVALLEVDNGIVDILEGDIGDVDALVASPSGVLREIKFDDFRAQLHKRGRDARSHDK